MKNMKKLLTMLSALAVGVTTATTAVGCKASSNPETTTINQLIDKIENETLKDNFVFKDFNEAQKKLEQKVTDFLKNYENWSPEDNSIGTFNFTNVKIGEIKEEKDQKLFDVKFTVEFFKQKDESKLDTSNADETKEVSLSNLNFYYTEEITTKIENLIKNYHQISEDKETKNEEKKWDKNDKEVATKISSFLKEKMTKIFDEDAYLSKKGYILTIGEIKIENKADVIFNATSSIIIEGQKTSSIKEERNIELKLEYGTI